MIAKVVRKIIQNPEMLISYPIIFFQRLQVKKVTRDGQVFYQYKGTLYPEYLNKGNAAATIVDKAKQYCEGTGIDVGADAWPFPGATPIQNAPDQNAYKLDRFAAESLDYVFSSHCLEHLAQWPDALKLWISKLKLGGTLFLYLPHKSMRLWSPCGAWVGLGHKWSPTHEVLLPFLTENGMKIVDYNPDKDKYWSFHIIAQKVKRV